MSRILYDKKDISNPKFKSKPGINEALVKQISKDKDEPTWMLKKRLEGLKLFFEKPMPNFGPDISDLNFNEISFYVRPGANKNSKKWEDVPKEIKDTFERLGIPEAEKKALAGVGAQYESEIIYHSLKQELAEQGVVFMDMDEAVQKYPNLVKRYFMTTCVPPELHKFTALHAAVWSGGTFIYVPKGISVELPLQAYFRMNTNKSGQFEHTLIIADEGSAIHYIEGCFTRGNKVRTEEGFVDIENIKKGDKVFSLEGKFKKVVNTFSHKYFGSIFEIQFHGDSTQKINATFEHPILFVKRQKKNEKNKSWKKEWGIPKYLKKGDYLCIPRNKIVYSTEKRKFKIKKYFGKKQKFKTINKIVNTNKDFFKLIGYYLAEGSISNNSYLNFSFGSHEDFLIEDVKKLIKKVFGIEKYYISEHKKNNGRNIVFSNVEICRIFKQFGTSCHSKQLPSWVMKESFSKQKQLLKGFWLGDGNFYKKRTESKGFLKEVIRTNTTSEILAYQIRDIYHRVGIPAFLNKQERMRENRRPIYTIGISGYYLKEAGEALGLKLKDKLNKKKRASMFHVDKDFIYFPIKSIESKKVKNIQVYNLSVQDSETYTIAGIVVHNCSAPLYKQNSLHAGCVEIHVKPGAHVRYSSIENWSKNVYNLNTKRGIVEEDGVLEWVNGNLGSKVTMLYPSSILLGNNSKTDYIGIAYAGKGQYQDTGCKVYHIGKNTSSNILSKSISLEGGIASYRGLVNVKPNAKNSTSYVKCDGLMLDDKSQSLTDPAMKIEENEVSVSHEASVGKIGEDQLFYLMSRGLSKEDATKMIVNGFIEPLINELPMEYAVELNRLIEMEIENSIL